jgi:hypothetical protein
MILKPLLLFQHFPQALIPVVSPTPTPASAPIVILLIFIATSESIAVTARKTKKETF